MKEELFNVARMKQNLIGHLLSDAVVAMVAVTQYIHV